MTAIPARKLDFLPLAGLAAILLLAWASYLPGLSGGFLFDDFVNLDALGKRGAIDDWPSFLRYLTSGTADPTGRPLALLSFLIDARDWPADPYPFLRTNLILHLLNGGLLYLLLRRLENQLSGRDDAGRWVALLAAAFWLLHPLLVSTTLYIVQREAILPATFSLLGLIVYVDGRRRYAESAGTRGIAAMWLGIGAGTFCALLCKANGILLPLLAATLATTTLRRNDAELSAPARSALRRHEFVLLVLPALAVAAYLSRFLFRLDKDLAHRAWTIGERLLTEPRVLCEYLGLLFVPRSISTGLFNDEYLVSTGWWQPATTLPSLMLVLGLMAAAWHWRSRMPRFSAAILFFFAGHVLESTVVPLELYFEHRNYLPAMLLFWPLAHVIVGWQRPVAWRAALAIGLLALLSFTTWQRASLWGQPDRLAQLWAARNPDSPRAQANAALALMGQKQPELAARILLPLWQARPYELQLAFNYVNARCAMGGITTQEAEAVARSLRGSDGEDLLTHRWLSRSLGAAAGNACPGMDLSTVERWISAARANPHIARIGQIDQTLEPLLGELAVHRGDPDLALQHYRKALRSQPNPDFAARMVAFLAAHGHYAQALALLDEYETIGHRQSRPRFGMARLHAKVMQWQGFWPHEMGELRRKLQEEIASRPVEGGDRGNDAVPNDDAPATPP
ncbi:tetratricopeptide repeat protein [Arenimonas sp.]|uniref:tetratricopeptide repeat protein n=1 Tax=Arenimonas sp. TaxID=1872635 RepID=UPI0039E3DCE7